jgi:hypothetical protein
LENPYKLGVLLLFMNIDKKEEMEEVNLREGNISLILDSYDDLFSDFDPRHYSERALSDDFLIECKRSARDKEWDIELRLLVPKNKRKHYEEPIIRRRLKEHFRKHLREEEREIRTIRKNGIIWFMIGSVILVISTLLFEFKGNLNPVAKFFWDFLLILSQPAGWFTSWEGLERIFVDYREHIPDYNFYKKMSNVNIYFLDY